MTDSTQPPEASSDPSPADADGPDGPGSSSSSGSSDSSGIDDDALPEDLRPGEDNPLAEPLDPDAEETKDVDELGMDDTQDEETTDGPDPDAAGGGSAPEEGGS